MVARHLARPSSLVLLVFAAAIAALGPAQATDDEPSGQRVPGPLEYIDDPPGVAARPVPGAPRATRWRVGEFEHVQVNVDANGANIPGDAANEPSMAIDPTRPNSLVIGWRQFDTVTSNFRQAGWAYTNDGGRTWTFPGVLTPGTFRSDPVLTFDSSGTIHYNSLEGNFTCDVFTSTDRGETWGAPVFAEGGDKQWQTEDRTGGQGDGHIYEVWSDFAGCCGSDMFTRSTDGASSFETPVSIPQRPRWGTIDVAPDGTVFAAGLDDNLSQFLVSRSTNAQNPAATPSFTTTAVNMGGSISWFGGPNPDGLLGQVWVAVDPSIGPTAGYVYVLCSVDPPGADPLDVHFIRSTDGGSSWSSPVRVNDDAPSSNGWQWFGTMSVAPNGRIDAVWNDSRNTLAANMSELYRSSSTDGGVTWTTNELLSPVWNSHLGWPNQNKVGDYYHMLSDRVGAHLAWAATFNGEQDVYYLRIGSYDCNSNGVADEIDIFQGTSDDDNVNGIPDECENEFVAVPNVVTDIDPVSVGPNPTTAAATFAFEIGEAETGVTVEIFTAEGRSVRTITESHLGAGRHRITWDGQDMRGRVVAPGVYLYRVIAGDRVDSGRINLVR